jgi:hypothetical protein
LLFLDYDDHHYPVDPNTAHVPPPTTCDIPSGPVTNLFCRSGLALGKFEGPCDSFTDDAGAIRRPGRRTAADRSDGLVAGSTNRRLVELSTGATLHDVLLVDFHFFLSSFHGESRYQYSVGSKDVFVVFEFVVVHTNDDGAPVHDLQPLFDPTTTTFTIATPRLLVHTSRR